MNQIHLKIIDFLMNGDSEWLHIEKFSCRPDKPLQNFAEKIFYRCIKNVCNLTNIMKLIFLKTPCWMCRSICWPVAADESLFIIRNANFWSFACALPAFLIPINIGAAFVFSKTFRSICLISKWLMFYDSSMVNHMMKKLELTLATNLTSFFWSLVLIFLKIRWLWVRAACITRLIISLTNNYYQNWESRTFFYSLNLVLNMLDLIWN